MNKLLQKVAKLFLGLSLAAGIGVAIGAGKKDGGSQVLAEDSTYNKVSSLSAGKEVLIVTHDTGGNYYIVDATTAATSSGPKAISVTAPVNNSFTGEHDSHLFTVAASSTNWKFSTGTKYLKWSSTSNNNAARINTGDSDNTWTYDSANGTLKFSSAIRYFGVWPSGSDWRTYNSSGANNYSGSGTNIEFYEKGSSKTLSSIAISGDLTTKSYTTAESWSKAGLTVTGTYSDSTTADLTSSATFKYYDSTGTSEVTPGSLGEGTHSIKVEATAGGKTSEKYLITGITITAVTYDNQSSLEEGEYFIKYSTYYFTGSVTSGKGASSTTKPGDAGKFTFTLIGDDTWSVINKSGNRLGISANGTTALALGSNSYTFKVIDGTSGTYKLQSLDYSTRYIALYVPESGSPDFRSYTTGNIELTLEPTTAKTLSSIALSGSYPTSFTTGDSFDHTGMTVTATYSDATTADVTSSATFSGYNMSIAGNQTVTVSYTEGGTTKTATYGITVSAPATPTISLSASSLSGYTGQLFSVTATYANLTSDFAWSATGAGTISGGVSGTTGTSTDGTSTYSGTLTGAGTKTLSASGGGADTQTYTITITKTTVSLNKASTSISVGKSETLTATTNVGSVTWNSSNTSAATVSNGVVSVPSNATVGATSTITATSAVDTSVKATCTVTVAEAPFEDVLTDTVIGTQSATYTSSWAEISNIEDSTGAKYMMRTMKPSSGSGYTMQTNANGYFVTTQCPSNAIVKSISFGFLTSGKDLAIYGSNTAYTAGTAPSATSLGTVSGTGSSVSFDFSGLDSTYKYVAFKGTASSTTVGTITVEYEALAVLDSVTTSGETTLFTAGNNFSYGGTLTAHYTGGKADATATPAYFKYGASGINPTSAGTSITTSTTLTKAEHDGKYIYVVYTEDEITKYCSYQITVNYAAVTSVVIGVHAAEIGLNETYNDYLDTSKVSVTINSQYANQGYEWIVSANTVNDEYVFDGSGLLSGDIEGTITLRCRSTSDNSKYDELVVTVTGDPTAAFDKESTSGYAGKTEVIGFTFGNMGDVSKITVASSNTSYVSVEDDLIAEDGVGFVTINFVAEGSANVTISYDGGSNLDTLTVTVNADSVSSISVKTNPSKTTYTVGETFSATGLVISANMASGDTVDLASNQYNLRNAPTVLNDRGVQTITVELVADTTKTTSFNITVNMPSGLKIVTKTSNHDGGYIASLLTSANTLTSGMKVAIGCANRQDIMAAYPGTGNNIKTLGLNDDNISVSYNGTNKQFTFSGTGADAAIYTLSSDEDGWILTDINGNRLYKPSGNNNYLKADTTSAGYHWSISLDENGVATISNTQYSSKGLLSRNNGASDNLYSCYASNSANIESIELYSVSEGESTYSYNAIDLSETIYDFIRAVYNNSDYYSCQSGGEGSSLTNWSNITSNAKYTALSSADKQNLANAVVSSPDGTKNSSEMVADFLSQYDYVVWKYGKSYDYLGRVDAGTASVRQSINLLSVMMGENTNTVAIIVIISMVSVTAVGGYFFIRKRKEQ